MVIYGLKNCDTCRKAAKELGGAELRDIRKDPLQAADLERFYARFGAALVNRKSATWRQLGEDERTRPELELLAAHPTLMKRPVRRCLKILAVCFLVSINVHGQRKVLVQ